MHGPKIGPKGQLAEQEARSRLWRISDPSVLSGDSVKRKVPGAFVSDGGGGRKSGQRLDLLNQLVRAFMVAELEMHSYHGFAEANFRVT
jgi:hypothetical protein